MVDSYNHLILTSVSGITGLLKTPLKYGKLVKNKITIKSRQKLICRAWCNGSCTMKTPDVNYPMVQFLIIAFCQMY